MTRTQRNTTVSARRTRYELLDTIAEGGMARVYLGRAQGAGGAQDAMPVAVKILHPHLAGDPDAVSLFLDEARVATRIVHPNVVRVKDVDMVGHDLVIVMEYVEGLALSGLLRALRDEKKTLPVPVVLRIVIDLLRGLHAAHELVTLEGDSMKIVHRDVSPHNVLVGADGLARVTDFGVASSVGRLAHTRTDGIVRGKLQYLAPEQIHRKPPDARVDVWASGTVLWECLTGTRLFGGAGTEAETIAEILRAPIDPPSTKRPEVPLELDDICLRALERDPDRRFPSAKDFADALENESGIQPALSTAVAELVETVAKEQIAQRREALVKGPKTPIELPEHFVAAAPAAERSSGPRGNVLAMIGVAVVSLVVGGVIVKLTSVRAPDPGAVAASTSASAAPASSIDDDLDDGGVAFEAPATSGTAASRVTPTGRPRPKTKTRGHGARPGTSASSRPFMPNEL